MILSWMELSDKKIMKLFKNIGLGYVKIDEGSK
jgi:hypothetical protein